MLAGVEEINRPHVVADGSAEIEVDHLLVVARRRHGID